MVGSKCRLREWTGSDGPDRLSSNEGTPRDIGLVDSDPIGPSSSHARLSQREIGHGTLHVCALPFTDELFN